MKTNIYIYIYIYIYICCEKIFIILTHVNVTYLQNNPGQTVPLSSKLLKVKYP